jgi:hypothetical protein
LPMPESVSRFQTGKNTKNHFYTVCWVAAAPLLLPPFSTMSPKAKRRLQNKSQDLFSGRRPIFTQCQRWVGTVRYDRALARFHRDWRARFGNELLGALVQTHGRRTLAPASRLRNFAITDFSVDWNCFVAGLLCNRPPNCSSRKRNVAHQTKVQDLFLRAAANLHPMPQSGGYSKV